jgi:hypothetical protein
VEEGEAGRARAESRSRRAGAGRRGPNRKLPDKHVFKPRTSDTMHSIGVFLGPQNQPIKDCAVYQKKFESRDSVVCSNCEYIIPSFSLAVGCCYQVSFPRLF